MVANWTGKPVTILGAARSGIATAFYLASLGADVLLSDAGTPKEEKLAQIKELEAKGVKVEVGGHSDLAISRADLIIASPGIQPITPIMQKARASGKEIISDIELAWRENKAPVIAITGTNGKSTTCALVSHILQGAGYKAPSCGNIGVPILSCFDQQPDFLVTEVSSFQLTYSPTFAPKIAMWLNLTPDHLDWHGSLESYIEAKQSVFAQQRNMQIAILNADDAIVAKTKTKAQIFWFSMDKPVISDFAQATNAAFLKGNDLVLRIGGKEKIICKTSDLLILGMHNVENALAAIAAVSTCGIDAEEIAAHLKTFAALEHRLEFVATVDGVKFYNDSKATNTDSAIKALESFVDEKVVLIAGGKDKGTDLTDFVNSARKHASAVVLLGEAKERFASAFAATGFKEIHRAESFAEAVDLAGQLKLGPVLLSPACASFDMFRDYEERGRVFKDIVRTRLKKLAPSA